MPNPAWPVSLPLPLRRGYSIEPDDSVLRTAMETGPALQRSIYTQVPDGGSRIFRFTNDQFAVFQGFYKHTLNNGPDWFDMPVLNGVGLNINTVRIVGKYRATDLHVNGWRVEVVIETKEPDLLSAEQTEVLGAYETDDVAYASPLLHQLIHVDLPGSEVWT